MSRQPLPRVAILAAAALVGLGSPLPAQRTPHVATVQITPSDAKVKVGDQAPFVAAAYDAAGNPIVTATFKWQSSNSAVASINQEGIATAVSPGLAIITVSTGSGETAKSAQAPIEVTAPPPLVVPAAPAAQSAVAPAGPVARSPRPAAAATMGRADSLRGACDGGDGRACATLGAMFAFGRNVARDYVRARSLFQRACDAGAARGCTNLGMLYQRGLGVASDSAQARAYYQRGCNGGDAQGCNLLRRSK